MTDDTSLNPTISTTDDWSAKYARQERLEAEAWPINKAAAFAVLAAANITQVLVTFDGCGDSGQIESVDAEANGTTVALPAASIAWLSVAWDAPAPERHQISVETAVENLAYGCLGRTHCGWENNAGAYGDITFDVAAQTITLDFNERFESSEYYQHVL